MAYVIDKKATEMQKRCINEAIKVVTDLDIPVSKNIEFILMNSNSFCGHCRELPDNTFLIRLNLNIVDEYELTCAAIHEMLHTINNEKHSAHRGYWREYAEYVSKNTNYVIRRTAHLAFGEKWQLGLAELDKKGRRHWIMRWLDLVIQDSSVVFSNHLNEVLYFATDFEMYVILHTLFTLDWNWGDVEDKTDVFGIIYSYLQGEVDNVIRKRIRREYVNGEYCIERRTPFEIWCFEGLFNDSKDVLEHSLKILGADYRERASQELEAYKIKDFDLMSVNKERTRLPVSIFLDSRGKEREDADENVVVYIQKNKEEDDCEKDLSTIDVSNGNVHFCEKYDGDLSIEEQRKVLAFIQKHARVIISHYNRKIDNITAYKMMIVN